MGNKLFDRQDKSEQEKYQFMKEQIRPQKKKKLIRYIKRVCGVVILALMFGLVAGSAFVAMQNLMWGNEDGAYKNNIEAISSQKQEPESQMIGSVADPEFKDAISTLKDYQRFCEKTAMVGEYCNRYVVAINETSEEKPLVGKDTSNITKSGAVIRESQKYYYILTESEGISAQKDIRVEFLESCSAEAEIAGADSSLGLVVLKVEKEDIPKKKRMQVVIAEFGDELNVKLNTPVVGIGSSNGVIGSVILGNVVKQGISGSVVDGDVSLYCTNIGYCKDGNGFVTDIKGKILGVITNSFTDITGESGCAFVGINKLLPAIKRMIQGKTLPYLGVKGLDLEEGVAEELQIKGGVYVSDVISGSPAYQAEIRVADIIVKIDDKEIDTIQKMRNYLDSCSFGEKITIFVKRSSGDDYIERKMEVVLN